MRIAETVQNSRAMTTIERAALLQYALFAVAAALLLYLFAPQAWSMPNMVAVLYYTSLVMPAVLGMYLLLLLGHFDLSIGSTAALSGVVAASMITGGWPIAIAIMAAVISSTAIGLVNWALVSLVNIPSLIASLIGMGLARAGALAIAGGTVIGGLPYQYTDLLLGGSATMWQLVAICGVATIIAEFAFRRHVLMRHFVFAGNCKDVARRVGINSVKLECIAFSAAGCGGGIVGLLQSARTMSASPLAFQDLALECITGCVIGGVGIKGGKGCPTGAVLGLLAIIAARNVVTISSIDIYWRELVVSLLLLTVMIKAAIKA